MYLFFFSKTYYLRIYNYICEGCKLSISFQKPGHRLAAHLPYYMAERKATPTPLDLYC